ncbi:MAG: hypothetical protein CVU38_11575 [Chloroflexi bacterium HGW-Chloroflexi-1]|nr:MAG: hypothetical protein CVU38_11575 [Chloroflexi bacterium HGW-Chloroflexi-1]
MSDILKRGVLLLGLVALLMPWPVALAAPPAQTQQPPAQRPVIFVRSSHTEPAQVAPDGIVELFVELHNIGSAGAIDVLVTFASNNFVPEGSSSLKSVPSLQPDEHATVSQRLRVAAGTAGGSYGVTVQLNYADGTGFPYSHTETVGVNVLAITPTPAPKAGQPQLVIESFTTDPALPIPGQPFTLTLTLHNTGSGAARNILLTNGAPSPYAPVAAGNVVAVGNIGWQETLQVTARLVADQGAAAGLHTHPIALDYDNWAGGHFQSTQNIAIELDKAPETAKIAEPLVVLDSYSVEPETLSPGQPFTLTLIVRNVGGAAARRVTVALTGGSTELGKTAPIAPLGTGNVKYLPAVQAEATDQVTARFIVDGAANAGVYLLTVAFEYSGSGEKPLTRAEQISLVVLVRPQLAFNFYRPVGAAVVGQPINLPIEILNIGRTRLNSTDAELVSDELQIQTPATYIGPLDPGTSVTSDGQAVAESPGVKRFVVRVHYIDDFNQAQIYERAMTVEVVGGGGFGPAGPGGPAGGPVILPEAPPRSFFVRLLRGLLGLGSA